MLVIKVVLIAQIVLVLYYSGARPGNRKSNVALVVTAKVHTASNIYSAPGHGELTVDYVA